MIFLKKKKVKVYRYFLISIHHIHLDYNLPDCILLGYNHLGFLGYNLFANRIHLDYILLDYHCNHLVHSHLDFHFDHTLLDCSLLDCNLLDYPNCSLLDCSCPGWSYFHNLLLP